MNPDQYKERGSLGQIMQLVAGFGLSRADLPESLRTRLEGSEPAPKPKAKPGPKRRPRQQPATEKADDQVEDEEAPLKRRRGQKEKEKGKKRKQ